MEPAFAHLLMTLIDRMVKALGSKSNAAIEEAIWYAFSLLEKEAWRGRQKGRSLARSMGWTAEVVRERLTPTKISRIRDALLRLIEKRSVHHLSGAIAAIGVLREARLKRLFVSLLREYLDGDPKVLYACMVALERLGEQTFGSARQRSLCDATENRRLARRYLLGGSGAGFGETPAGASERPRGPKGKVGK